jgi:hypothetical protein
MTGDRNFSWLLQERDDSRNSGENCRPRDATAAPGRCLKTSLTILFITDTVVFICRFCTQRHRFARNLGGKKRSVKENRSVAQVN